MSQPHAELPTSENSATKQTVFNDLKYKPRGAGNVLAFEDTYQPIETEKPAAKMRVTVIKQERKLKDWVWEARTEALSKETVSLALDSSIETSSTAYNVQINGAWLYARPATEQERI